MDPSLNQEAKSVWDANADFWDSRMGEGNEFHKTLIEPCQLQLLDVKPGMRILDLACGNGQFARKLAAVGATVVAADGSARMIEKAKQRTKAQEAVAFRQADCTSEAELRALGADFDAAVCTMALMDIADLDPLARTLPLIIKSRGVFVFSVLHPCFNSGYAKHGIERYDQDNEVITEGYVRVMKYIRAATTKGLAMEGQPKSQYYFHRPLKELLGAFFHTGFQLDGLEEPVFPDPTRGVYQRAYSQIPAALLVRLRNEKWT